MPEEPNELEQAARRQALLSSRLAIVSLLLMLVTMSIQLTVGGLTPFTTFLNMITCGILGAVATLNGRTLRILKDLRGHRSA